jgi:hypothetical protein
MYKGVKSFRKEEIKKLPKQMENQSSVQQQIAQAAL